MYLSKPSCTFPSRHAEITKDYAPLGISKLQAKIYHDYYHLRKIAFAEGPALEDLLTQSIKKTIQQTRLEKSSVDHVIYAHTSLTKSPFGINVLVNAARRNQLAHANCFSFNLNNCVSGIEALSRIEQLLKADNTYQHIILVAGDQHFTAQQRILQNASLAGDGFSAVLLSRQPDINDLKLITTHKIVYPEFYQGAWLDKEQANAFELSFPKMMASALTSLVNKAKINFNQIRYILPHNVNLPIWKKINAELALDWQKIYIDNIPKHGHCSTADFLINIESVHEQLEPGDYVVAACVGFGLTFVSALFQKI